MNKFATRFALLAVMGAMTAAAPPALAQSGSNVDCRDPANFRSPACMNMHRPGVTPNGGMSGGGPSSSNSRSSPNRFGHSFNNDNSTTSEQTSPRDDNGSSNGTNSLRRGSNANSNDVVQGGGASNSNVFRQGGRARGPDMHNGPQGPGGMMMPPDRDQFRRHFRDFHFSPFPRPDFAIRPGMVVPRHYALRPLPRALFRNYPFYRGFLFFMTRDGSIVIVNPRTYRIVAII